MKKAYKTGEMHNTLRNIGRKVVKTHMSVIEIVAKRLTSETSYKFAKANGTIGIVGNVEEYGDTLISSISGDELMLLSSHGSGELSTLGVNTALNIVISNIFLSTNIGHDNLRIVYKRMVGDDMILNSKARIDNADQYDDLGKTLVDISHNCGDICNIQKTILLYGIVEFRQTCALRGLNIAHDQITLISCEKPTNTDNIQSYIQSFAMVLRTKIARGFSIQLAWQIIWFVTIFVSR